MALFGWLLGLIWGPDEPLLTAISAVPSSADSACAREPPSGSWVGAVLGGLFQALDRTEHSFALAGQRFLTLHYQIERLAVPRA